MVAAAIIRNPSEIFREAVVRATGDCLAGRRFLRDALQLEFERRRIPPEERGPANELASGIVRRKITLDHILTAFSDLPLVELHPLLLSILRLGAYEILFTDDVPAHAAVNEAVNLTKRLVRAAFGGFTNAVLRTLSRSIERKYRTKSFVAMRTELPAVEGGVVRFSRELFSDPVTDPLAYLNEAGGMPRWVLERWRKNYGLEQTRRLVEASNSKPPVAIRVNRLKTTVEELMQKLSDAGVSARPGDVPWSLVIESPVTLTELDSFRAGEFYIQDTSAMRAPEVLAPKPAEKVLDLCAAPGGKTTQLAEIALGRARIFALDESPERLRLVEENASRLGITCVRTGIGNARKIADPWRATFGATLADVPCSNTGVLRRRVEARHRLTPDDITRLAEMQADILETALASVRPGGRVVYSTCSIEPEENGELVRRLLARHTTLLLDFEETVLPEAEGPDGAYIARLTDTRRG